MGYFACHVCGAVSDQRWCPEHRGTSKDGRPTPAQRGYGRTFQANRRRLLASNPTCIDCPQPATVADHTPFTRRELVTQGVENPDDIKWLKPRCITCHNRRTAKGL